MADSRADQCIREHEQLASLRGIWENHWREVAERVRPNQNYFQRQQRPDGDKRQEKVFDATAPLALPKFGAAVISMAMPASQQYQRLAPVEDSLEEDSATRRYLDAVTNILFKVRYAPQANFQSQSGEVILDVGAFGTGILFIDDVLGIGIRYKSFPLAECYIAEDAHGRVDTLHRKYPLTAHQAVSMFGLDNLPKRIRDAFEKNPMQKFDFLHCVKPNPEKMARRRDWRSWDVYSCYTALEDRSIVSEGGFRTFPFAVPRYETSPRECYGRSPAMNVLPAIKTLNEQKKTILRAAQRVVDPPIMLSDDGSLQAFNTRPNALNYGYVGSDGRPLAQPFNTNGRIDIGRDMMQDERDAINDAFFVTLFRILVEEPQITATEAMLRAQEKGQLLGPTMGRIQAEMLGPQTQRELDILSAAGVLPPMPPALAESGGQIKIEYQSPLNLAQRAGAGMAIMNTVAAIAPLAQVEPSVMMIFDPIAAARELAIINGTPEKVLRTPEQVAEMLEEKAKQAQAQQLLEAAPVAAGAAKDFAQAQAMAGAAPNGQAPAVIPGA
jgi:hypothetical protein